MEPIRLELVCPICGGQRTLEYDDDRVHVAYSCDARASFGAPPAAFADRDREEIPAVASRYLRAELARLESGSCPYCEGRLEHHVCPPDPDDHPRDNCSPVIRYEC